MAQFLSLEIEYVTLILMSTIELQILSFVLKLISDMKDVYGNYK